MCILPLINALKGRQEEEKVFVVLAWLISSFIVQHHHLSWTSLSHRQHARASSCRRSIPRRRRIRLVVGPSSTMHARNSVSDDSIHLTLPRLLVTLSTPIIHPIYFLTHSSIKYGAWGWCSGDGTCLRQFAWTWSPQIIPWLLKAIEILLPIGEPVRPGMFRWCAHHIHGWGVATGCAFLAIMAIILDILYPFSYQLTNPLWFRLFAVRSLVVLFFNSRLLMLFTS